MTGNYTVAAWINPDDIADAYKGIMGTRNGSTNGFGLILRNNSTNDLYFHSAGVSKYSNYPIAEDGTRKHVAYVRNGGSGTFYVNGVAVANVTGAAINDGGVLHIGGYGSSDTTSRFDGKIDEPRIYNRALSADEISTLYRSNLSKINTTQRNFSYTTLGLSDGTYIYS